MKTIAVVRLSAMGDVAMTSPVIRRMAECYPDVRIVLVVRPFYRPFFDGIPNLEFFPLDLNGRHGGILGVLRLYLDLRRAYSIDMFADLHSIIRNKVLRFMFRLAGIPTAKINKGKDDKRLAVRPKNKVVRQLRNSVYRYADVFAALGYPLELSGSLPNIPQSIPQSVTETTGPKHGRWIGIAPFAQHRGKRYPIEHIRTLISMLEADGDTTIFVFGGGDDEYRQVMELRESFPAIVCVIGLTDLRGELALISNLNVMISMDSSAMHMASLVGTRVVSVWGATHPCTGFLGYGQSMDDVVSIDLPCRPCSVYGSRPCLRHDYACLTTLAPELIYNKVSK